jgi:hypothetical protein
LALGTIFIEISEEETYLFRTQSVTTGFLNLYTIDIQMGNFLLWEAVWNAEKCSAESLPLLP